MVEEKSGVKRDKCGEDGCCCSSNALPAAGSIQPWTFTHSIGPRVIYRWMDGSVLSMAGEIPRVRTKLDVRDMFGSWKARWGIGRKTYRIPPGLYAAGSPSPDSPVLVTANYKMSFDRLRSRLSGRNVWLLVLDTKGINVWCAAGKGTFGTDEVVRRVEAARLAEVVTHRKLILPQLGATGVSAHEVLDRSGWRITYGPIRSEDLAVYFDSGMKVTPRMRRVTFSMISRLILVPVELVMSAKYLLIAVACLLVLSGLGSHGYSLGQIKSVGVRSVLLFVMAYITGAAVTPVLLPWLPGPAFSLKGAAAGALAMGMVLAAAISGTAVFDNRLEAASWLLMVPAVASFLAMNFTGASTYASPSGVRREMRLAVPMQIGAVSIGLMMWVAALFI